MGYAHGIMKTSKIGNPKTLHHLLSDELYETTVVWIQSWHFASVFMDAKLDKIKFNKIDKTEGKAIVETDEKWFYAYYFIENNETVYPEKEILYKIRYYLVNKENKWMITKIDILDEKSEIDDPNILIYPIEEANKRPYKPQYSPPKEPKK